jgi:D-alanine-D-alanine ligase-like ATP-grasp enzyme
VDHFAWPDAARKPCSEVRIEEGRSFDYDGKYLGAGSTEIAPAEVSPEIFAESQKLAVACHRALGCSCGPQGFQWARFCRLSA